MSASRNGDTSVLSLYEELGKKLREAAKLQEANEKELTALRFQFKNLKVFSRRLQIAKSTLQQECQSLRASSKQLRQDNEQLKKNIREVNAENEILDIDIKNWERRFQESEKKYETAAGRVLAIGLELTTGGKATVEAMPSADTSHTLAGKKRKLTDYKSSETISVTVDANALKALKAVAELGPKPHWDLLEWRESGDASENGIPVMSPNCLKALTTLGLSIAGIMQTDAGTLTVECDQFNDKLVGFIKANGFLNKHPMVKLQSGVSCVLQEAVFVREISKGSTHTHALDGQRGVYAKKDLPRGTALSEYFGLEFTKEDFDVVHEWSRSETQRNRYAFDKHLDDMCIITDPLGLEGFNGTLDCTLPTFTEECRVFSLINDCREDIGVAVTDADDIRKNCEFVRAKVNGWPRVFVVLCKDIAIGEQLLGDYGTDYGSACVSQQLYERKNAMNVERFNALIGSDLLLD